MLKFTITLEMDEEQLQDIFESRDIKFSKAKAKKLQKEMDNSLDTIQMDLDDKFEEIVDDWIQEIFE
jgi:protein-tyrosine-phosphatase